MSRHNNPTRRIAPSTQSTVFARLKKNRRLGPQGKRRALSITAAFIIVAAVVSLLTVDPFGRRLLIARADSTAQNLPFSQNWTNTGLITTNDNWNGVPGIIGYRGDGLVSSTGVNPQTVLTESTVVNVIANQANPNTLATGGVAEFEIANPVVALQGSGTARAPYVQFHINTTGLANINIAYNLRDVDGSADNAIQPVALQYRVGNTGNFTNVAAGFVADATTGPSLATLVTPVSVTLPAAVNNQPLVQVRVITTDAVGSDEWVGIDDVNITASSVPTGVGNANPNSVFPTGTTLLTVAVTPASDPTSTAHTVTADLTLIGGSASQSFLDNGLNGDAFAGDNIFSYNATVASGTSGGSKLLPFTITETAPQSRVGNGSISLTVEASTNPTGIGAASPNPVQLGANSLLTVTVTPGTNPTSSGITVIGDLTAIGGSASQHFFDDGSNGDVTPGNNVFTFNANIPANISTGVKVLPIQVADLEARSSSTSISLTVQAPPPPAGSLAISQLYGGGGNAGATFRNDFIEIINRTGTTISLNGLSVQYASAAGTSWQVTNLSGSLGPGQYYLIQEASGGANGAVNPTADATGTTNMSGTAGKVALVASTIGLTEACPSDPAIIDFVGFGTSASCFEGSGPTPAPSNANAVFRENNGCTDTDDNAEDFSPDVANPRNSSSPTNNCAVFGGIGSANPASVQPGDSSTLTVNVTPGSDPTSTGIAVSADLSSIGGSANQSFSGIGNSFTFLATIALGTTPGQKSLPVTITDAQSRTANTTINLTVLQPPPSADHVVISQVYGGGGNAGATYKNDFVELYNPGSSPFDLTGWSVQYASFNGSGWGSNKQPLGGTIPAGTYYLIKLAGGTEGADLPAANVEGVINLSGSTGKVALVSSFQPLSGTCPLADPNLVDFVGYGSNASTSGFCYEGTAPATTASNATQSVLRKSAGSTDTNNNSNDFQTGAVNPRRTAPIVELGPNVLTTDPTSNGFNIPHDASISVSFTEPVDVVGSWYNIACADLTTHNDATVVVSNNFKSYLIIPNVNFAFGQQCTVTINKDNVHDQDLDDSGPNTDSPPSDYSWTFSVVGAGAPAPYPPSVHLTMGNPSNAVADVFQFNNYLMEKPTYSLSYNRDKGTPNWVSWHLEPAWFGSLVRFDTFRADPAVPPDWYRVLGTDYSGSGFDRGHMTPNADRDNENRIPINQETYLMTNMVPQAPDNNQGPWAAFEGYLRSILGSAPNESEIYIVSGPLGVGGSGANGGTTTSIANNHVTVPAFTWKVVLVLPKGEDDVSRVTASTRTIAIMMPNTQGIRNNDWHLYLTTVDAVEQATGYDFFASVPDDIENAIEAGTDGNNFPGTAGQAVTTTEDNSTNITLTAVSPGPPLTYTIVTPPAHGQLTGTDGNRSYAPDLNYNGSDSFTFKVNDGNHDSNTSTVSITVSEVNDPPTADDDDAGTTDEDVPLNISAADLATNDSSGPANESLQILTVTSVSATADTHGSVALETGVITYTPAADYNGPASFSYQVCDNGTTNGAADPLCANGTVNLIVSAVNDNPVANNDSATTSEDNAVTVDVVANDTDVDADTRTLQSVGTAAHGSVTIVSGQSQYSPGANFNGSDTFDYVVSDGHGGTATGTVNITITEVNDNAAASNDTKSTNEDTTLNFAATDLTANDSAGPANEATQTLTVTTVTATANTHGSVSLNSGTISYGPDLNYNGPASFSYQVCDNGTTNGALDSKCATATVNVTVNSVNDAPVLTGVPATASVVYGTNLTFTAQATDVDLPAQTLTFSLVGAPAGASINPSSGVFSWTPTAAQAGTNHTFSVSVTDGQNPTASSITVTVQLKPLTSLGPAQVWLGVKTGGDAGTKFDLLAEIFRNGVAIGSGQLNDVDSGAVNFNNALLQTIPLTQAGATGFRTGDTLSIRLSIRIADSSSHKNGTARLWYNDAGANSNFAATIGGVANSYFLRTGSVLTTTVGSGPRSTIDVTVKRTGGNPFTPFGTWSITY
jgi:DNA/RNA endonuclease G (NUC1)